MMPGETHSKMAGIASEAAGSCQNCTSLQQSLNEYVAALIALKQKIIDSDQLLAEHQQKCDDLQYAERQNETLRCQLEQMLQKISPQEQHLEELTSLKAQLEEKTSTLKIYQQTQLEYVRVKEECEKSDIAKKKLEAKLKKMEEAAAKHDKDYKQLRLEKKVIGKELKKIQKKLDCFQKEKSKKVAMKNAQTQVARKEPVVKLDKQKIKYLLEEIWGCVESSAENGDCNLLMFDKRLRKIKSSSECKLSSHNNLEVNQTHNPLTELDTVHASLPLTKQCNSPHNEPAVVELMDVSDFGGDAALKIVVSKDLSDCSSVNSDLESDIDELWEAQDWAKPLPNLLSPIHCSPLTVKNVFGEITDSSEDESISERDRSNGVSQPKIESSLANGTDKNSNLNHEVEHVLEVTCNFDDPDLTTEIQTNMHDLKQTTDILPLHEAQAVTKDPIQMECEKRIHPLTNSTTCTEEFLTDSLNDPGPRSQSPKFCESPLTEIENVAMSLDADSGIQDSVCHTEKDKLRLDNTTTSCSQSGNVKKPSEIVGKINDLTGNSEPLGSIVANKSPTPEKPLAQNDLKPHKDILSGDKPNVTTLSCDQETLLNMQSDNCSKNEESSSLNDLLHGKQNMSNDYSAHSKDTIWQQSLQNSGDGDLSKVSEENLDKALNPMSTLMNNCTEETDQPCITSHEKSVLQDLEQSQQSEPLRQTPPLLSSNNLSTVLDCRVHINKTYETHIDKVANVMNEHNTFTSMESQCKIVDKEECDLEKCSLQNEMLDHEPEQQNCSDFEIDKVASAFIFHNKAEQYERTLSEPVDHSSPASPVNQKAETELQSSQIDTSKLGICDSKVSQSSTVYPNDKCLPCIDFNTDSSSPDIDNSIHQDFNQPSVLSSSPVDLAVDHEHKKVENRVETQCRKEAQSIEFSNDLNSSISEEKNTILCPLSKADLTGVKATSSSKVLPVVLEELQHLHIPSESDDSFKIVKKDALDVSLDSSESDYEFPIRKVNFTRPTLNDQVVKNESFRNSSDATKSGDNAISIMKKQDDLQEHTDQNGKPVATVIKPSTHSNDSKVEKDILIEPRNSALHTLDTESETCERNAGADGSSDGKSKDHSSLEESARQDDISDLVNSDNGAEKNVKNDAETEGQRILPGKNLIWNFSRPDDFVDPRTVCLTRKQKTNSENVCVNSNNSVSKSFQTLTKENIPHRLPHVGTVPVNAQVGQTVLATADTSTSTGLSPETINKVRSEMGPPLPPLLGPLLPTPPRSMRSLSPIMSSSSRSSLPSPLDELISPLPGTPFPPLMSPLCDGRKRKSPIFNTPSPAEKANQRILSSPLQFCAATPKHAVPVPGRLPLSANGSSACNVQENSVKILDTMYPELSARARTLNILKGNVHLNRGMSGDSQNVPVSQITGFKSITSTSTVFIKTGSNSNTSNKEKPNTCENQISSESQTSVNKRSIESFQMPKSAKRLRLDSESPIAESVKDCFSVPEKSLDTQKVDESSQNFSYCEPLPDIVKGNSVDEDIITNALKKVEELCFDLLPVIRSHIHVGTIPNVPVMRNEEKEVIYDFSSSKKGLADRFLHILLKKIKSGKRSLASSYLQALCRVYVGLCRQLGDIERARVLCYSILKEDFPDPDKLLLFIISSWNDILSLHGVLSKAIQAVLKSLAVDDVGSCLSAYLNWEKCPPMNRSVLLNSVLMAIQLYPDVQFHQSEKYGEDLTDNVWEYVFAVDLLCSHRKWTWTHENVISKELWPILDKWVRRKKGNLTFQFVPDIIVATVLRLVGHLCQMGLKEGFITAVKNVTSVIITFLNHANEEGVPWGVQLASVYMLCDTAPCDPVLIHQTLLTWKETAKNNLPPAVINLMQETASLCVSNK
ncbi:little elongation complex subunit 1 [Hyla sarda]|uniref:little elongation complex subunit 1 n=1 Tax=Hyla sarda TaxID=327740 RepID=UPI0024C25BC5|nr:little elongation complex subunit 1 [Hyla sarda]